jgi:hypothetical protein
VARATVRWRSPRRDLVRLPAICAEVGVLEVEIAWRDEDALVELTRSVLSPRTRRPDRLEAQAPAVAAARFTHRIEAVGAGLMFGLWPLPLDGVGGRRLAGSSVRPSASPSGRRSICSAPCRISAPSRPAG